MSYSWRRSLSYYYKKLLDFRPMSDKSLVVVSSSTAPVASRTAGLRAGASIEARSHDDLDVLVDQLLRRQANEGSGTVSEILAHPQIRKHGILGRLSASQQSLATSVVSLMQDKVATDARKNADALKQVIVHEREALRQMSHSFADTARHLYQLPLWRSAKSESVIDVVDGASMGGGGGSPPAGVTARPSSSAASPWMRILTWGNLLAGTAIVLAVLVVKTSVDTASYETRYHLTQEHLTQVQGDFEQLQAKHQQLLAEHKTLAEQNAALAARSTANDEQQQGAQQRFESDRIAFQNQVDEAQRRVAQQQEQLAHLQAQLAASESGARQQIAGLRQELALLKGERGVQGDNVRAWQQLAEQRQLEISRLQAELHKQVPVEKEEPANRKAFFGLF
ncbi:Hypothetical protein HDN1F_14470 [gamma proteobacterium HdN1]|nr:Hypothetical protein HDN1F_14470 [gamma proteobacterium HdN1]